MNCEKCGKYSGKYSLCKECYYEQNNLEPDISDFTEKNITDDELVCPICGEPTSVYMGNARKDKLCRNHAKMLKNGEIKICDDCGKWHDSNKVCACKTDSEQSSKIETKCIVCGKDSYNKELCKECYHEVIDAERDIDKNKKPWELKDYYYNLKAFIGRLKNYDEAISNLYRLYAIAWILQKIYNDTQLSEVVTNDVKYLLKQISKIKEYRSNEQQQQNDKTIIAVADIEKNRASDGHICKSEGEVIIDDILFKGKVCHAYARRVKEIPSTKERSVIADWYIPIDGFEGIYIEYWGMNTKDYQDNKEEKLKLYEKYKDEVKLIEINKNDTKDRQNLEDRIFQELKNLGWHK